MIRFLGICLALALPSNAWSFEPVFSEQARELANAPKSAGSYALPTAVFSKNVVPSRVIQGAVSRASWRISDGSIGTSSLALDIESQLDAQGYDLIFSCSANACGGFDFRFNTEVLLPPSMFVDLSDYVFLSALRESDAGPEAAGVLISRTAQASMVQVISVGPLDSVKTSRDVTAVKSKTEKKAKSAIPRLPNSEGDYNPAHSASTFGASLVAKGHSVLSDLSFEIGSSTLSQGPFASLEVLADFLNDDPARRVALVGHTDSEGALKSNINLSQKRAAAVRLRLLNSYNVSAAQVDALGAGYLAPISSNQTVEGRGLNRRVEAVLLSGD